ncbi:hypothetical protein RvY_09945 [Ramazzottius varieornatus]|uniref:Uncharacterized protein n=1 Tax=Ramazzottius varieornatus TaxID=947166 RepID=A0A1D1VK36_RAMVA|nr:hypothetical protein RvY_09945 [Ramazzottius varieornatus]
MKIAMNIALIFGQVEICEQRTFISEGGSKDVSVQSLATSRLFVLVSEFGMYVSVKYFIDTPSVRVLSNNFITSYQDGK